MTYKMIPTVYFDKDGNKAKALTEGGFYRLSRMVEKSIADNFCDIWDNEKTDGLLSLQETLQNVEIRYQICHTSKRNT